MIESSEQCCQECVEHHVQAGWPVGQQGGELCETSDSHRQRYCRRDRRISNAEK